MWDLGRIVFLGTMAGVLGTGAGGFSLALFGRPKGNLLSFLLAFSSGIMLAVVFQDLIPESLVLGNPAFTFLGIVLGVVALWVTSLCLPHPPANHPLPTTRLVQTGVLLGLGIAMHNLPEGLAIGAGYVASEELGLGLAFALSLHNIPEGMAMAAPLIAGGLSRVKVVLWTIVTGLPMGIGALFGGLFGSGSPLILAGALGFAAGAMLFLVFHELLPQAQRLGFPRYSTLGVIIGVFLGLFALLAL